jgi:hypothetical protein
MLGAGRGALSLLSRLFCERASDRHTRELFRIDDDDAWNQKITVTRFLKDTYLWNSSNLNIAMLKLNTGLMRELELSEMQIYKELSTQKVSTAWIFPLYFQLPYLPEETCFQQGGSSAVEGTSQPISKK